MIQNAIVDELHSGAKQGGEGNLFLFAAIVKYFRSWGSRRTQPKRLQQRTAGISNS